MMMTERMTANRMVLGTLTMVMTDLATSPFEGLKAWAAEATAHEAAQ